MTAVIDVRGVVAFSSQFPLLTGVDLSVTTGEVVHVVGANGAGKTSLLRLLAGLVPISEGAAVVLGHDLRVDRRGVRPEVGFLGHDLAAYAELSAAANLEFFLGGGAARSADALQRVGLVGRLATIPLGRLSLGQRRRAALALLVARAPRLWLLDEPHAGLDAEGRELVDALVREAIEGGTTVVFSSHDVMAAGAIASRSVELQGGRTTSAALEP